MSAIKEYAYLGARMSVGLLLIVAGTMDLWATWLGFVTGRGPRFHLWPLYGFVVGLPLAIVPIVLGIAVLRQRARGLATGYCLLALMAEAFGWSYHPHEGRANLMYAALYAAATIVLLIPNPRFRIRNPPASPEGANWRRWLLASLQGEGVIPVRDRFQRGFGSALTVTIVVLSLFVVVLLFGLPVILGMVPRSAMLITIPVGLLAFYGVWKSIERRTGGSLDNLQRRALIAMRARSAEDELWRAGSRRPVLYLRSFALDARLQHEDAVMKELRKIGPVVAIGRPGEDLPPLGASRFYVDDRHWQTKVEDIVRVAQLVIWATGVSEGLRWELAHLRASLPPERLILWTHPSLLGLSGAQAEAEWRQFLTNLGYLLPAPLPTELGDIKYLFFDSQWQTFAARGNEQVGPLLAVLRTKGLLRQSSLRWRVVLAWTQIIGGCVIAVLVLTLALLRLFRFI
jgi:hypothetical protein